MTKIRFSMRCEKRKPMKYPNLFYFNFLFVQIKRTHIYTV